MPAADPAMRSGPRPNINMIVRHINSTWALHYFRFD